MNLDTPQKQLLLYAVQTPSKIVVNYDINGWMETSKKSSPFKQIKKYPPKPNPYKLATLSNLKRRR